MWRAARPGDHAVLVTAAIVFTALLLLPAMASSFAVSNATFFLVSVPLVLGLALLWGHCGILSFGQVAFFGLAGYTYAVVMGNVPDESLWTIFATFCALGLVAVVAAIFGYFVFYGRVSGWITPILTLALTLILELFFGQTSGYQWRIGHALLGGFNGMNVIPPIRVGGHQFSVFDNSLFFLAVAMCAGLFVALQLFSRSRAGAVVRAIRDDAERAELLGHNIRRVQVMVFVAAAILAALSGLLYVWWGNYIDPSSFGLINATLPVIYAVVGGKESFLAVIVSTLLLGYLADLLSVQGGQYAFIVMGALLLAAMMFFPNGIVAAAGSMALALVRRLLPLRILPQPGPHCSGDASIVGTQRAPSAASGLANAPRCILVVDTVSKHFGGLNAVDKLSLFIDSGEICCIVGPNGAGKSTLFNLICGRLRQDKGKIIFSGTDLGMLQPYQRSQLGLAIKFQSSRVFNALPVHENLAVASSRPVDGTARAMLAEGQICETDATPAGDLGPTQRQVLEIAMALSSSPRLLLLDEPTVGMTAREARNLAKRFRALAAGGLTLLIIEHDMEFVREVADRIVVLHRGRYYASGPVDEIEQHPGVREIYLGSA